MATPPSRLIFGMIPWYGALIVLGAALAIQGADREARRCGLPRDTIIDLALWVLPMGILGARIYYVLFSWPAFAADPVSILYLWNGGLAIYGGLIAGFLTVFFFCKVRKLSLRMILDILIPWVALAQAIGRWGNYFNQEAYGLALSPDSPLAFFPLAVLIQSGQGVRWHLAAFFYEFLLDLAIFLFLCYGRRRLFRKQGDVFLFYLLCYAAGRLIIENVRMDSLYLGSGVRVSQLLSVLLCLAGIGILLFRADGRCRLFLRWIVGWGEAALGIVVLLICLNLLSLPRKTEMLLLAVYSGYTLLTSLILYGSSSPSEVIYAHHPV